MRSILSPTVKLLFLILGAAITTTDVAPKDKANPAKHIPTPNEQDSIEALVELTDSTGGIYIYIFNHE